MPSSHFVAVSSAANSRSTGRPGGRESHFKVAHPQEKLSALRLKHTILLGLVRVRAFTLLGLAEQQLLTAQSGINQESRAKSRCYPFPMPRFHRPFDPRSME